MNNSRRKELIKALENLDKLKNVSNNAEALKLAEEAVKKIDIVVDEEQMAYDNMPENLQWSARADIYTDNLDNLLDAQADAMLIADAYRKAKDNPYNTLNKELASVFKNCTEVIERR